MVTPEQIGHPLCEDCYLYVVYHGFAEYLRPIWQPDARARRQAHLELAGLKRGAIAKKIAEFEVGQWDP